MIELSEYFNKAFQNHSTADISLCGKLEAFVGNYFVYGEGTADNNFHWLTVFYDPNIVPVTESVKTISENIVAYVSSDYKWGFVLKSHSEKLREDKKEFDIYFIEVNSFEEQILKCLNTELLPDEFSGIVWIDDDFMNDDSIPFDFESFYKIDDGIQFLNPKHFSASQFLGIMNIT